MESGAPWGWQSWAALREQASRDPGGGGGRENGFQASVFGLSVPLPPSGPHEPK